MTGISLVYRPRRPSRCGSSGDRVGLLFFWNVWPVQFWIALFEQQRESRWKRPLEDRNGF